MTAEMGPPNNEMLEKGRILYLKISSKNVVLEFAFLFELK